MKKFTVLVTGIVVFTVFSSMQSLSVKQGGTPVYATLLGENERPNPGDPDGYGTFEMTLNQGLGLLYLCINGRKHCTGNGCPYPCGTAQLRQALCSFR